MVRNIKDIPEPAFGSELNTVIVELEKLRIKPLHGTVPPYVFFQLKDIFQALESLGSTRIEGNRTTVSEYAEKIIAGVKPDKDEAMREIMNLDKAIDFIEKNIAPGTQITRAILSEIHKIVVEGLTPPKEGEGSRYPGAYRGHNVGIENSALKTSDHLLVPAECEELFSFINGEYATQYHLLVMALSHHRFTVVHPFDNGNGRVVRMLTYAQLLQQGFSVKSGRILNPTAIFCDSRDTYYDMLARADEGTDEGLLDWCLYVLKGLAREIEKIDKLLNRTYLRDEILLPMLDRALKNKYITNDEFVLLQYVVRRSEEMTIRAGDLEELLDVASAVQRSRIIGRLIEKEMLKPIEKGGRIYTIHFFGNFLFREVTQLLIEKGFVPESLNKN
ncbi:MAG: Fic family protein [Candidatus Kaiserbacteria bacterium]|nr:Fic family protein [Candidatus Kaiserbacteria bacterium]